MPSVAGERSASGGVAERSAAPLVLATRMGEPELRRRRRDALGPRSAASSGADCLGRPDLLVQANLAVMHRHTLAQHARLRHRLHCGTEQNILPPRPSPVVLAEAPTTGNPTPIAPPRGPWHDPAAASVERPWPSFTALRNLLSGCRHAIPVRTRCTHALCHAAKTLASWHLPALFVGRRRQRNLSELITEDPHVAGTSPC